MFSVVPWERERGGKKTFFIFIELGRIKFSNFLPGRKRERERPRNLSKYTTRELLFNINRNIREKFSHLSVEKKEEKTQNQNFKKVKTME